MKIDKDRFEEWLRLQVIHENLNVKNSEGGNVYEKLDAMISEIRSEVFTEILNAIHEPQDYNICWMVKK